MRAIIYFLLLMIFLGPHSGASSIFLIIIIEGRRTKEWHSEQPMSKHNWNKAAGFFIAADILKKMFESNDGHES